MSKVLESIKNYIFPCYSNQSTSDSDNDSEDLDIDFQKIPDDEFICPYCEQVPEILNINIENSKIELKCKKCGINEIKIEFYFYKMENSNYNYLKTKCYFCGNTPQKKNENSENTPQNKNENSESTPQNKNEICENIPQNKNEICENTFQNKNDIFYFCYECKKNLCNKCKTAHQNENKHNFIEVNKKKSKCIKHVNEEFENFCVDCQENVCERAKIQQHKGNHELKEKNTFNSDAKEYRKLIMEKNKNLSKLVRFNELILKTCQKFQDNYFLMKNVINLGKSIKKENKRDSKETHFIFKELTNNHTEDSRKAIEKLKRKKNIFLETKDEFIHLRYTNNSLKDNNEKTDQNEKIENNEKNDNDKNENNKNCEDEKNLLSENVKEIPNINNEKGNESRKNESHEILKDDGFKLISLIQFTQLKEIDVTNNCITNIDPLKEMFLPFLEYLNMSFNQIENIKPIAKLYSLKLKDIILTQNQIKDITPFKDSTFPELEYLRIEKNDELNENEIKEIKKIFKNKFFSEEMTLEKIQKNYKIEKFYKQNDKSFIKLTDIKGGDDMLKDIYLFLTCNLTNNIKKLILMNCNINDPSILCKIPFHNLKKLDLALNNIKNLNFLFNMKCQDLQEFYINDNKINNINSLIKIKEKFKNINVICLNENNFDPLEENNKKILNDLKYKDNIKVESNEKIIKCCI